MTITVLTCATHRPEAWALCERYMAAQTRPPDQWLVLDDGGEPSRCTMGQEYYFLPHCRGRESLTKKIHVAFQAGLVRGDVCVIWENDDYYAPTWIEWCADKLQRLALVGEGRALYYNVLYRYWFEHENMRHASLCSTAFTRAVYPTVQTMAVNPNPYIDDRLWRKFRGRKKVFASPKRLVIGLKEMPGMPGYGSGRGEPGPGCFRDPNLTKLREVIGEDANLYASFHHA